MTELHALAILNYDQPLLINVYWWCEHDRLLRLVELGVLQDFIRHHLQRPSLLMRLADGLLQYVQRFRIDVVLVGNLVWGAQAARGHVRRTQKSSPDMGRSDGAGAEAKHTADLTTSPRPLSLSSLSSIFCRRFMQRSRRQDRCAP